MRVEERIFRKFEVEKCDGGRGVSREKELQYPVKC
jgi:hypothetical protein